MTNATVLTDANQATPVWLTAVLREKGLLKNGRVQSITRESFDSVHAQMTRLQVTYEGDVDAALPHNFMLKIVLSEPGDFGESEVAYYVRDYTDLPDAPLVPCYHAAYDGTHYAYHLLLADVSPTHHNNWEKPLTLEYGRTLAEALAILHSHWWGVERLEQTGIQWPYTRQIDLHLDNVRHGLEPLLKETKGEIPAQWEAMLRLIVNEHPVAMRKRMAQDIHFTLIHGDANPGNILSPIGGETPLYIVDRQPFEWSFTHWLGVFDLAYSLGLWGDPAVRRQLEMEILHYYHAKLVHLGITGYSWDQLVDDYRLCLLQLAYHPLAWCVDPENVQKMKWAWLPQLQRVMTAVTELNCLDLIE